MKKDIITLDYSMARDMILNYPCAFPYLTIVPQDFIRMMTECSQHVAFKSETSIENLFENVHSMLLSLTDHLNNSSHGILVIQGDYSSIRAFPSQTHIAAPDVIEKMTSFIWGWQQTLTTTSEPNPALTILLILGSNNRNI